MNQKLSDWANVAQIVSGVAVVATLVFLILGIRENTAVTRATAYDRNMDSLNFVRNVLVTDREMLAAWQAFMQEPSTLDEPGYLRVQYFVQMLFGVYEKSYFASRYELLGDSEWSRYKTQICTQLAYVAASPRAIANLRTVVTPEFMRYMESECSTGAP